MQDYTLEKQTNKGFTLFFVLVVLAFLALLLAEETRFYAKNSAVFRARKAVLQTNVILQTVAKYYLQTGDIVSGKTTDDTPFNEEHLSGIKKNPYNEAYYYEIVKDSDDSMVVKVSVTVNDRIAQKMFFTYFQDFITSDISDPNMVISYKLPKRFSADIEDHNFSTDDQDNSLKAASSIDDLKHTDCLPKDPSITPSTFDNIFGFNQFVTDLEANADDQKIVSLTGFTINEHHSLVGLNGNKRQRPSITASGFLIGLISSAAKHGGAIVNSTLHFIRLLQTLDNTAGGKPFPDVVKPKLHGRILYQTIQLNT